MYHHSSSIASLINAEGELSTTINFNGKEVENSCAVTYENKNYIFGGQSGANKRQVLELDNCELTEIGTLTFDHYHGACGSFNSVIVLCFDVLSDLKQCRQSSSPLGPWTLMATSTYEHKMTSIATSPGTTSERRHLR